MQGSDSDLIAYQLLWQLYNLLAEKAAVILAFVEVKADILVIVLNAKSDETIA